MKPSTNFWLALLLHDRLGQAGVIHLDVASDGGISVDIASTSPTFSENVRVANNKPKSFIAAKPLSTTLEPYDVDLEYEIHRGHLSGDQSYVNFSNIPYAEPPLGFGRFKAPRPIYEYSEKVNEGLDARICPQIELGWVPLAIDFLSCYGGALESKCSFKNNWTTPITPEDYKMFNGSKDSRVSEDCLLLDVIVPKSVWDNRNDTSKPKAPVVVWIHGGGYVFGWKDQAGSPASFFKAAKEGGGDIIYVSMNYRLGAFGWLGGSTFLGLGGTANAGLLDQNFALEWVYDNIHLFGGDKDSVTVMGQSAGASSILHHITLAGGETGYEPRFQRAIMQSPAFFPEGDLQQTIYTFDEFRFRVGALDLYGLQTKSTHDLQLVNAIMTYYSQYGLFRFGPVVDWSYVPSLPGKLLAAGQYHKNISIMMGHTILDGLLFTPPWIRDDESLAKYIESLYPETPRNTLDTVKQIDYYKIPGGDNELPKINAVSDLLDDIAVSCNNYYLTEAVLKTSDVPIYRFLFGAKPAVHGSDLNFTYYPNEPVQKFVDPELATFMQRKFINFARTGNPNGKETPKWPEYKVADNILGNRLIMNFGDLTGPKRYAGTDPLKRKRCALWQPAPFRPDDGGMLKKQDPNSQWEL